MRGDETGSHSLSTSPILISSISRLRLVTGVVDPSMKNSQLEVRKKKPPTFQHLPLNRGMSTADFWPVNPSHQIPSSPSKLRN